MLYKLCMSIFLIIMIWCIFFIIKNQNTFIQRTKVIDAMYLYNLRCIETGVYSDAVDFRNIESYNSTVYRLFDWGYENIIPKEDLEKVRPFIKE